MSKHWEAAVEAAVEALTGYTGACTCHEAYTSRNLADPECSHCDIEGAHIEILTGALPHLRRHIIAELREKALDEKAKMHGQIVGRRHLTGSVLSSEVTALHTAESAARWLAAQEQP